MAAGTECAFCSYKSPELGANLIRHLCVKYAIKHLDLHSDNGAPMRGAVMLATLQRLGVMPSFSRPGVSNDNPYSESLFKTLKYRPGYPEYFYSIPDAECWVTNFVHWYNTIHMHSGIKYVTPDQRHFGLDKQILQERANTYKKAYKASPERWSRNVRNWNWEEKVFLNPVKSIITVDNVA